MLSLEVEVDEGVVGVEDYEGYGPEEAEEEEGCVE